MQTIGEVIDGFVEAFYPEPMRYEINGKVYLIEKIGAGWTWRNEDGDCQEDFGIEPFGTACEALQSALDMQSSRPLSRGIKLRPYQQRAVDRILECDDLNAIKVLREHLL